MGSQVQENENENEDKNENNSNYNNNNNTNTNCIKMDTGLSKKEERPSTRNLEKDDRGRNENSGRYGKNLRRQQWTGSNGNLWSQLYVPPKRNEDYVTDMYVVM